MIEKYTPHGKLHSTWHYCPHLFFQAPPGNGSTDGFQAPPGNGSTDGFEGEATIVIH